MTRVVFPKYKIYLRPSVNHVRNFCYDNSYLSNKDINISELHNKPGNFAEAFLKQSEITSKIKDKTQEAKEMDTFLCRQPSDKSFKNYLKNSKFVQVGFTHINEL